jgi:hypothetical protein
MNYRTKAFLLSAILFLVLGLGNLVFGSVKYHQYRKVLKSIDSLGDDSAALPSFQIQKKFAGGLQDTTRQTSRKIIARISFYRLVQHGGKVFLLVSGILLLCAFVANAKRSGETQSLISLGCIWLRVGWFS